MLHVVVVLETGSWADELPDSEALAHRMAQAAATATPEVLGEAELCVVFSDDAHLRTLNRDYRATDKPTNVLAFANDTPPRVGPRLLGDVVIAFETAASEAADQGKTLSDHVSHLLVHGVLHLLGYDHTGAVDAARMEDLERTVLADFGIPDPYVVGDLEGQTETTASGVAPPAQTL